MWSDKSRSNKSGSSKRNKSILRSLRARELHGIVSAATSNSDHFKVTSRKLFRGIPSRLAFSLKEVVDEHILLEEAHVFLGFNSDGTYVISYTESYEAVDQTGLPSYSYQLHWWLFKLNRKMVKVNTVRLFANEEILSSLQLYYAEWPRDKTQILVYGCCRSSENCFITVCAVPSKNRCENCIFDNSAEGQQRIKCFKHGFVAHMKHSSVSTSSAVLNASGLQIDGLIVLNMGHSIAVISLGLLSSSKGAENLPLSSIKHAAFEEKPNLNEADEFSSPTLIEKANEILLSPRLNVSNLNIICSPTGENDSLPGAFKNSSFTYGSETLTSLSTESNSQKLSDWDSIASPSPIELSQPICISLSEELSSSDHCNCSEKDRFSTDSPASESEEKEESHGIDPYVDPEPKSIVLLQRSCENTSSNMHVSNEDDDNSYMMNRINDKTAQSENCCCGYSPNRCSEHDSFYLRSRFIKAPDKNKLSQETNLKLNRSCRMTNELQNVTQNCKICTYCGLKVKEKVKKIEMQASLPVATRPLVGSPARNSSKKLFLSSIRSTKDFHDNFVELNAPTPSPSASESSGSVYCTGDTTSQASIKSGSCRKSDGIVTFNETLYEPRRDLSSDIDHGALASENGLFFGPVTFEDAKGVPLQPVRSESPDSCVAYSQHLVLDVEHVIFDVLRTRCYTTYKFGYLIDYDVQIIDTCPSTRSVVILIVALLNVSPRKSKKGQEHLYRFNEKFDSSANILQQFQFFICWQLRTGRYEVVTASPLRVFDPKKSGKWDAGWVLETRHAIRKTCAIPQSPHCAVHVLSNSSVFRGKSLDYLWDVDRVIAMKR